MTDAGLPLWPGNDSGKRRAHDNEITVQLGERQVRALIRAGDLTADCLASGGLDVPDALSLAMGRLESALERQQYAAR
jgi:hypothetical protein